MTPSQTPSPHILLVNPWIHDFAAYDVWARPLGLLYLAAVLRDHGCRVSYIDCTDRHHPQARPVDPKSRHGRGPYRKQTIAPPPALKDIPRRYSRYGIEPEWFRSDLGALDRPDLVLVTSLMTYWYPGVIETIKEIRAAFPETPVVLGGVYATLCPEHARAHAGADTVASGATEADILEIVSSHIGVPIAPRYDLADIHALPYPALDLAHSVSMAPLLTARGCPYRCAYCASSLLAPTCTRRRPAAVAAEIAHWHSRYGVSNMAFYDDALLVDAESMAIPLFESICAMQVDIRFHTPNAVHIRHISPRVADLMYRAGFDTVRLGLETMAFENRSALDEKVSAREFRQAMAHLTEAGFSQKRIGTYLLVGLPGQQVSAVEQAIDLVRTAGATPILAQYTPIPGTRLWPAAVAASRYDLATDPVLTNRALMPCSSDGFSWETIGRLKERARLGC